jgi:hypothetical protein
MEIVVRYQKYYLILHFMVFASRRDFLNALTNYVLLLVVESKKSDPTYTHFAA